MGQEDSQEVQRAGSHWVGYTGEGLKVKKAKILLQKNQVLNLQNHKKTVSAILQEEFKEQSAIGKKSVQTANRIFGNSIKEQESSVDSLDLNSPGLASRLLSKRKSLHFDL